MSKFSNKTGAIAPNTVQKIQYIHFVFYLIALTHPIIFAQSAGSGFSVRSVTGGDISNQKVIGSYPGFDIDGDGNGEFVVHLEEGGETADDVIIFESSDDNTYSKVWGVNYDDDSGDGEGFNAVVIADSDGDGRLEVIVAQQDPDKILIYEYSGSGAITDGSNPSETAVATLTLANTCTGIVVTDLDDDGNNEIIVGTIDNTKGLYAFETDGNDSYAIAVTYDVGEGDSDDGSSNICGASDFDGDGDLEIAVAGDNGRLYVFEFDGSAFSEEYESGDLDDEGNPIGQGQRIAYGNLDNSGRDEIIITNQRDDEIYIFEGTSENTYSKDASDEVQDNGSTNIGALTVGDYDGDGNYEIYYAESDDIRYREFSGSAGSFTSSDFSSENNLVINMGSTVKSVNVWTGSGSLYIDGDLYQDFICTKTDGNDEDEIIIVESSTISIPAKISGSSDHFRMMSSPVDDQIYSDLLSELWTQGMTGADVTSGDANVWTYSGTAWAALSDISGSGDGASLTAGQGFLVFVYVDTDNDGDTGDTGASGYLPVILTVSGTENSATVSISTTEDADDDGEGGGAGTGWNLLGNPFATTIDADELFTDNTKFKDVVYVYDHSGSSASSPDEDVSGGGIYRAWNSSAGSLTGGLIAPYQGFFVQTDTDWESGTNYQFQADAKSSSAGTFYKTMADNTGSISFTISSGNYTNQTFVSFMNNGEEGIDGSDAYKLLPMTPGERVVGISYAEGNGLDISNLPYSQEGSIAIPLDVMYLTVDDDYNFVTIENDVTMSWDLSSLPETIIGLTLTDNTTNATTDLLQSEELTFTTIAKGSFPAYGSNGVNIYPQVGESQFTLSVAYSALTTNDDMMPKEFALHPAYPNPFNPTATITFDVPAQTHSNASLQIYDITGRLVATLVDEQLAPGTHTLQWQPVNLSSGLYIVQLKAGEKIFNQKITFIK